MSEHAFHRSHSEMLKERPARTSTVGVIGWIRTNLFGGPLNTVLTLLSALLLYWTLPPLLDWALRESASGLATLYDGSLDGLDRIFAGEAVASGLHIFEPGSGNWNVDHVSELMGGSPYVLIEFAKRQQGLIVTPKAVGAIKSIKDLKGRTIIHRQPTAGARLLFEHLLADAGLDHHTVTAISAIARTEADAAEIVASGKADATLGIEAMALQYHLGFIPLIEERFDLLVNRRACFEAPLQALFAFCRTTTFADKAKSMGGYNLATHGNVHWNGG